MRITGLLIVLLLFIPSGLFAQNAPVRVIYHPPWNISKLPMYLARERGIFEHNGLKVAWISPGSNDNLLAALKKGEADIAVVSANHIAQNNASGGAPMRLVGNTGYNYSAFLAATRRSKTPAISKARKSAAAKKAGQHAGSTNAVSAKKTRHRSGTRCHVGTSRRESQLDKGEEPAVGRNRRHDGDGGDSL